MNSSGLWICMHLGCLSSVMLLLAGPASAAELLVSSSFTNQVLRYDGKTGIFTDVFISGGGLSAPRGLLLGNDGNVYVSSYSSDSVKKYDAATGAYLGDFVTAGLGGLDGPDGLCWGPDGNLYVSSNLTNRIIRYQGPAAATPGALIDTFVAAGAGGLSGPRGILFGNDQYTGGSPGPAQDGNPDLLVCSYNSGKVLRYHGLTGAYVDVYAHVNGVTNLIYEFAYEDSNRYDTLHRGNLLVLDVTGVLHIISGTFSHAEHQAVGLGETNNYGPFFTGLASPRGMAWGPDRGMGGTVGNFDMFQDLYVASLGNDNVAVVGSEESNLGNLFASNLGGLDAPQYLLFKCGNRVPPLIRKVLNNNALHGSVHTLILQGDSLDLLTSVRLRKMRQGGALGWNGTVFVDPVPGSLHMVGNDLHVDFDLNAVEAGRYGVVPVDPCQVAGWFPDSVLVYLPELTNTGFEEGWTPDREHLYVCDNPDQWSGGGGNKSRPTHWEVARFGDSNQWEILRDGNIWHPCTIPTGPSSVAKGVTGQRYGSVVCNIGGGLFQEVAMFQTIAAPYVVGQTTTEAYSVYVDARMASPQRESIGYIRLIDGTDKSKWNQQATNIITQTEIQNTQGTDPDGLVRSPGFVATVPAGYIYETDPPVLTVMFVLRSVPGDTDVHGLKGLHLDAVRNSYIVCDRSPWADADADGDIDQVDFAEFQRCLSIGASMTEACGCFDRTGNQKVELDDFPFFTQCATGPDVILPLPPECQ